MNGKKYFRKLEKERAKKLKRTTKNTISRQKSIIERALQEGLAYGKERVMFAISENSNLRKEVIDYYSKKGFYFDFFATMNRCKYYDIILNPTEEVINEEN